MKRCAWLTLTQCLVALAIGGCTEGPQVAGIEGSGINNSGAVATVATAAYGRISGLGSIVVNGVHYDTTDAKVAINGREGTAADLVAGQIVNIAATLSSTSATTGDADTIVVEYAVAGPIQLIDIPANSVVVLGQTVHLADSTYDTSIPQQAISGLSAGDSVSVSGFRDQQNRIIASWIGRLGDDESLVARGVISNLEPFVSFDINGLHIEYAGVSADLTNGSVVDVRGSSLDAGTNTLVADEVRLRPTDVIAQAGDYVDLEGYVTDIESSETQDLEIAGLPITLTDATRIDGQLSTDTRAEAKGILAADGVLLANRIASDRPASSGSLHTITGMVFDAYEGPVANVSVNAFILLPTFGYSWTWAHPGKIIYTDSAGRFSVPEIPDATVMIHIGGWLAGYLQPCAVTLDVRADVVRDIEVVSADTLNSFAPPRPLLVSEPTITGMVYETTEAGVQPVAGAIVAADTAMIDRAMTLTDLSGRYFLCDMEPSEVALGVYKDGYVSRYVWPIDESQPSIDIEIERELNSGE